MSEKRVIINQETGKLYDTESDTFYTPTIAEILTEDDQSEYFSNFPGAERVCSCTIIDTLSGGIKLELVPWIAVKTRRES